MRAPPLEAPALSPPGRLRLMGIEVDPVTIPDLHDLIDKAVCEDRKVVIAHQNLHGAFLHARDPAMRKLAERAAAVHVDGMALIAWGRLLGHPLRREHRVTYIDWIYHLMALAAEHGWRVFYLGSRPDVAARGAVVLRQQYPTLDLVARQGFFDPTPAGIENSEVVAHIRRHRPHLLLVGMGMPRQERWILENMDDLSANVILPCGACIDYVAGELPVAPRWMARIGLEWLFRLMTEPRRLAKRYLVEPWSLIGPMLSDVRLRMAQPPPGAPTSAVERGKSAAVEAYSDVAFSTLRLLADEDVQHAVIRTSPEEILPGSHDIDLLVLREDAARARRILSRAGFVSVPTRYPASGRLFRKVTAQGLLTFHVQHHLCFHGPKDTVFLDGLAKTVVDAATLSRGGLFTAPEINALIFLARDAYEGRSSAKGRKAIEEFFPDWTPAPKEPRRDEPGDLAEIWMARGVVVRRKSLRLRRRMRHIFERARTMARSIWRRPSVAVFGVDGTGKSTVIARLDEVFCGRLRLQYMGEKDWELTVLENRLGSPTRSRPSLGIVGCLAIGLLHYAEMWYRILKHSRFSGTVLYDRYPSERFLRKSGGMRLTNFLLYGPFLPRPSHIVYLHCSVERSVERKKEEAWSRDQVETLRTRKGQFDRHFLNGRRVISICTDHLDPPEVASEIIRRLPGSFARHL